jgi:hypothetical protein
MLNIPGHKKKCKLKSRANSTSLLLQWLSSRTQTAPVGEDVGKRNPHTLLVGLYISIITMGKSMEIPQKSKNRTAV